MKIISVKTLKELVDKNAIKVLDATLPPASEAVYERMSIPGAAYLRTSAFKTDNGLPNTFPTPEIVEKRVSELGLNPEDNIAVYEQPGKPGATRAHFVLSQYGFENVSVVDGGIGKWFALGFPTEAGQGDPEEKTSVTGLAVQKDEYASLDYVIEKLEAQDGNVQYIDSRPESGFKGEATDNLEGVRQGKIPGAIHFTPGHVHNGADSFKEFKTDEEVAQIAADLGIDKEKEQVVYCRTGIAATITFHALSRAGYKNLKMFDGSWTEYGRSDRTVKFD